MMDEAMDVEMENISDDSPDSSFNTQDLKLDKLVLFYYDQIQRNADILKDDLETIRKRCIVPDLPKLVKQNKVSERLAKSILNQIDGTTHKFMEIMNNLNVDLRYQMLNRFTSQTPPGCSQLASTTDRSLEITPPSSTTTFEEPHSGLNLETGNEPTTTAEVSSPEPSSPEAVVTNSTLVTVNNTPSKVKPTLFPEERPSNVHSYSSEISVATTNAVTEPETHQPVEVADETISISSSDLDTTDAGQTLDSEEHSNPDDVEHEDPADLEHEEPADLEHEEPADLEQEDAADLEQEDAADLEHEDPAALEHESSPLSKSSEVMETDPLTSSTSDDQSTTNIAIESEENSVAFEPNRSSTPVTQDLESIEIIPPTPTDDADPEHGLADKDDHLPSTSKEKSSEAGGESDLLKCPKLTQITKVIVEKLSEGTLNHYTSKRNLSKVIQSSSDVDDESDEDALLKLERNLTRICKETEKSLPKKSTANSLTPAKNSKKSKKKKQDTDDSSDSCVELSSESDSDVATIPCADLEAPSTSFPNVDSSSTSGSDLEDNLSSAEEAVKNDKAKKKKPVQATSDDEKSKGKEKKSDKQKPISLSKLRVIISSSEEEEETSKDEQTLDVKQEKKDSESNADSTSDEKEDKSKQKKLKGKDGDEADKSGKKKIVSVDVDIFRSVDSPSEETSKKSTKRKDRKDTSKRQTDSGSDSDFLPTRKKLLNTKLLSKKIKEICESDSDEDVKPLGITSKVRSKRGVSSGGSESETSTKKKQPKKRLRIKKESTTDSSDSDCVIVDSKKKEKSTKTAESPSGKTGLRKLISKKDLQKTTRQAGKEEEERKRRVAENQKLYNEVLAKTNKESATELVLGFDRQTKKPKVSVDPSIVKCLKPHQLNGIKFMWDNCYESIEAVEKNGPGGGCILAHCMGLGKTLQTIGFLHTVMTSDICKTKRALVICPLNTVGNWWSEFRQWCTDCETRVPLHRLWDFKGKQRFDALADWEKFGGVGILHYDSFRTLTSLGEKKGKGKPSPREVKIIESSLLDPGPEVVVCDEGHLLKNASSKQAQAVMKIRTARRIVLTGTPLQNDLMEYHTMMSFVKPNLLGTKKEFRNRFVNPIEKGQHKSSDQHDVQIMKRRAHVLHKLLDGCVQRLDYSVLTPYLPPKYEYAISINLSKLQKDLYHYYLTNVSAKANGTILSRQLFCDYQSLVKVWTHPVVLNRRRNGSGSSYSDADSLKDFICDEETTDSDATTHSAESDVEIIDDDGKKKAKEGDDPAPAPVTSSGPWYSSILKTQDNLEVPELSGKILVLFEILKTCARIGDKVLVFSQFLSSLDLIETFLKYMDREAVEQESGVIDLDGDETERLGRWRPEIEYFRIDGSVKSEDRHRSCKTFNQDRAQCAKLFLISTKAGGLGINLTGANRVVMFDASWNPSHDIQSIFRVFRFGQNKPCYIYRLLARGTMEEKIYNRQVVKLSLSCRVVDEQQIERHFQYDEVQEMYNFNPNDTTERPIPAVPKDRLLADLLISHKDWIFSYLEHDSLLENKEEEELTEEERRAAWEEYTNEDKPKPQVMDVWTLEIHKALTEKYPEKNAAEVFQITQLCRAKFQHCDRLFAVMRTPGLSTEQIQVYAKEVNETAASLKAIFGDGKDWTNLFQTQHQRPPVQPQPSTSQQGYRLSTQPRVAHNTAGVPRLPVQSAWRPQYPPSTFSGSSLGYPTGPNFAQMLGNQAKAAFAGQEQDKRTTSVEEHLRNQAKRNMQQTMSQVPNLNRIQQEKQLAALQMKRQVPNLPASQQQRQVPNLPTSQPQRQVPNFAPSQQQRPVPNLIPQTKSAATALSTTGPSSRQTRSSASSSSIGQTAEAVRNTPAPVIRRERERSRKNGPVPGLLPTTQSAADTSALRRRGTAVSRSGLPNYSTRDDRPSSTTSEPEVILPD